MTSITTKKGDKGETSLFSGERVKKSSTTMEVLGTLDELNSWLGLLKCRIGESPLREDIQAIQLRVFAIASRLATRPESKSFDTLPAFEESDVHRLEEFQQRLVDQTRMPATFIVPGTNEQSAVIDIARTVCRRCERVLVRFQNQEQRDVQREIQYLNRLSDVLYILARHFEGGEFLEKR